MVLFMQQIVCFSIKNNKNIKLLQIITEFRDLIIRRIFLEFKMLTRYQLKLNIRRKSLTNDHI